jgi:hypothetical protein
MGEEYGNNMSVHIYKDNLRQSLFRTLLFTDTVVFVLIGAGIAGFTFLLFKITFGNFNFLSYLFMLSLLEPTFFVIATIKRDNQPIYKLLSRGIYFLLTKKHFRGSELSDYYSDFAIQDNLIVKKHRISEVFAIKPYDISALNSEERNGFFAGLQQVLHILPQRLQIIVRKEVAKPEDFTDHLLHVYKSLPKGNKQKEQMVANYQQDLLSFVQSQNLLTVKQYGVLSVNADTNNVSEKVDAVGRLGDMYARVSSALEGCHIKTKQLTSEELEQYMRRLLR